MLPRGQDGASQTGTFLSSCKLEEAEMEEGREASAREGQDLRPHHCGVLAPSQSPKALPSPCSKYPSTVRTRL